MFQKRIGQNGENEAGGMAETARSAAEAGGREGAAKPDDEKMSIFWRVFGGAILSIITLVGITIFNNVSSGIAELRAELNREREARAELVKKDEFNSRTNTQYERIRSFEGLKAEIEGLKERANTNAAAIDGLKKDAAAALDTARKELAALADSFKRDGAALEILRERVAALAADVKTAREELARVGQEVERNKTADLERKAFRDTQQKQVDDVLKELQKDLLLCREKLARLEGSAAAPPARGPVGPSEPTGAPKSGGPGGG